MATIPLFMPQPSDPPPESPFTDGAKIINQRVDSHGDVLVRWALPNLRTATVRMPYSQWVEGWAHLYAHPLTRLSQGKDVHWNHNRPRH